MQFANGMMQTLAVSAQLATDTVFTPTTTAGFPTAPQFTLLNIRTGELMLVTAMAAQWTVVRAYGGSSASPINAGDAMQYSITREMLIGGMMVKLDEQVLAADTPGAIMTVTVPAWAVGLCHGLQVRWVGTGNSGNSYLMWRLNNDAGASAYSNSYMYGGSGSSNSNWANVSFGRCWMGYSNPLPFVGTDIRIDFNNCATADRYKTWQAHQWLSQNNDQSIYTMEFAGRWVPTTNAPVSTIQFSNDNAANGVWAAGIIRAGARAILYGVP
jgi:hypothetical protein